MHFSKQKDDCSDESLHKKHNVHRNYVAAVKTLKRSPP